MMRQGLVGALASLVIVTILMFTLQPPVSASTTADQPGGSATAQIAYQTTQSVPAPAASTNSGLNNMPPVLLLVAGTIIVVGLALRRASAPYAG